jgi:type VI secretion system protein ImpK
MSFSNSLNGKGQLVEPTAGANHARSQRIRGLLRDTALLVTQLATSQTPRGFQALRDTCEQLIEQFSAELEREGYPDDVREEAIVAQCGLLDETALRHLSAADQSRWDAKPLQIARTGRHDAGERVFAHIEQRMREPSPNVDLLECYASILAMGFVGRYASPRWNLDEGDGIAKRAALIGELNARIETLRPARDRTFIITRSGQRFSNWLYRMSPWAITGVAGVMAFAVWLAWNATLDAQLAQLVSQTARP